MATTQDTDHDLFAQVQETFSRLQLDQKASFLITETANTALEAVSMLIHTVSNECTELFNTAATVEEEPDDTGSNEEVDSPKNKAD